MPSNSTYDALRNRTALTINEDDNTRRVVYVEGDCSNAAAGDTIYDGGRTFSVYAATAAAICVHERRTPLQIEVSQPLMEVPAFNEPLRRVRVPRGDRNVVVREGDAVVGRGTLIQDSILWDGDMLDHVRDRLMSEITTVQHSFPHDRTPRSTLVVLAGGPGDGTEMVVEGAPPTIAFAVCEPLAYDHEGMSVPQVMPTTEVLYERCGGEPGAPVVYAFTGPEEAQVEPASQPLPELRVQVPDSIRASTGPLEQRAREATRRITEAATAAGASMQELGDAIRRSIDVDRWTSLTTHGMFGEPRPGESRAARVDPLVAQTIAAARVDAQVVAPESIVRVATS